MEVPDICFGFGNDNANVGNLDWQSTKEIAPNVTVSNILPLNAEVLSRLKS